jgi:hypothetical protein
MALSIGLDTYADLATLEAVLISYGFPSYLDSTDDPTLEAHARSGRLYLDNAFAWVGTRSTAGQALAWPRVGCLDIDGNPIPADVVPQEIIVSQSLLMAACANGPLTGSSGGNDPDREIISEAADDAHVRYQPGSGARRYPMVGALVRHLILTNALGPFRQMTCARGRSSPGRFRGCRLRRAVSRALPLLASPRYPTRLIRLRPTQVAAVLRRRGATTRLPRRNGPPHRTHTPAASVPIAGFEEVCWPGE